MELNYTVKRSSKRRKLTITVERDRSVIVHAPEKTSDEKIREVVDSKRHWIYQKLHHGQKYQDLPHPPGKELVSGESILYLGREYRIELDHSIGQAFFRAGRFMVPEKKIDERFMAIENWYKEKAEANILPRVRVFARRLGVTYNSAKIITSHFSWGSCTPKNNLHFNWRLVKAPSHVIDYVVVHELVHLMEPNHSKRFWNILSAQLPRMDRAKTWLKENGQLLEQVV